MAFLSGKQAFLEILKEEGVEVMFGNPGTTELPLMDGLAREPKIRYILALQEAVAIAMADGYAQASGKLAAVNVHTSPGLGNSMGMLYDAMKAGSPLLLTAGQHDQAMNLTEPILWSELTPVARPWVKWAHEITRLEDLPRAVRRAAKTALAHPTGPVFISLPVDVLNAERELDLLAPTRIAPRTRGDKAAVEAAADLLAKAKRPILIAGDAIAHGDALNEMVEVAELLGAPVYTECIPSTCSFPFTHPLYQGPFARLGGPIRALLMQHDLLFSVGGDLFTLSLPSDVEPMPEGLPLIHMDVDPWEIGKNYPAQVAIAGDPKATLPDLAEALRRRLSPATNKDARARTAALGAAMDKRRRAMRETAAAEAGRTPISPLSLVAAVVDAMPEDAIVVDESISSGNGLRELLRSSDPRSFYGIRGGGIGWGLPAALGVKLAQPAPAGGRPHRRRQRHVHQPGVLDGGARFDPRRLRHLQQRVVPHPEAAHARAEGLLGGGRPLRRDGSRESHHRLRGPGEVARRAGRAGGKDRRRRVPRCSAASPRAARIWSTRASTGRSRGSQRESSVPTISPWVTVRAAKDARPRVRRNGWLCRHFDVVNLALRSRNRYTVLAHAFEMELDGLADLGLHFFERSTGGNAPGKIRDIRGVVALGFLDHDRVPHSHLTSSVHACEGSSPNLAQPLSHAGLPPGPSGPPAFDDVSRQAQRDQFPRIQRQGPTALVDLRAGKHFFGQLRQLFVLLGLHRMSIDASKVRLQGAARCALSLVHWPSSC